MFQTPICTGLWEALGKKGWHIFSRWKTTPVHRWKTSPVQMIAVVSGLKQISPSVLASLTFSFFYLLSCSWPLILLSSPPSQSCTYVHVLGRPGGGRPQRRAEEAACHGCPCPGGARRRRPGPARTTRRGSGLPMPRQCAGGRPRSAGHAQNPRPPPCLHPLAVQILGHVMRNFLHSFLWCEIFLIHSCDAKFVL